MLLFYLPPSPPDPFADATKGDDRLPAGTEDYIHIRIQQRNGRKTLTTVQGISADYDKKKLVKAFKKVQSRDSCISSLALTSPMFLYRYCHYQIVPTPAECRCLIHYFVSVWP